MMAKYDSKCLVCGTGYDFLKGHNCLGPKTTREKPMRKVKKKVTRKRKSPWKTKRGRRQDLRKEAKYRPRKKYKKGLASKGDWRKPYKDKSEFDRKRIRSPKEFDPRSFRTKEVKKGVKVVIGCPKGKYSPKTERCKVGTRAQAILTRKKSNPKLKKFRIWYGKYGQLDKIVEAKSSTDVMRKFSKLDVHQIDPINKKRSNPKLTNSSAKAIASVWDKSPKTKRKELARELGYKAEWGELTFKELGKRGGGMLQRDLIKLEAIRKRKQTPADVGIAAAKKERAYYEKKWKREKRKEKAFRSSRIKKASIEAKARTLMIMDNQIWDKHGWKHAGAINKAIYRKEISKRVKGKIPIIYYYIFEDANFHSLNKALEDLNRFEGEYGSVDAEEQWKAYRKAGGRTWDLIKLIKEMANTEKKQFAKDWERKLLMAKAKAYSDTSLKRPLTDEEFDKYKAIMEKIRNPKKKRRKKTKRKSRAFPKNAPIGKKVKIKRKGRVITFKKVKKEGFGSWRIISNKKA